MKPKQPSDNVYLFDSGCFLANLYLLLPSTPGEGRAVVIDPWQSEEACELLEQKGISQLLLLLTHEHYDHTTGVNFLRQRFDCTLVCQTSCADNIAKLRNNRPLGIMGREEEKRIAQVIGPFTCRADERFDTQHSLLWDGRNLTLTHTPGHSKGSVCISVGCFCFCGDSALLGLPTITRFPGGDQAQYDAVTLPFLLSLPEDTRLLPGHGESFLKSEVQYINGCFSKNKGRRRLKEPVGGKEHGL